MNPLSLPGDFLSRQFSHAAIWAQFNLSTVQHNLTPGQRRPASVAFLWAATEDLSAPANLLFTSLESLQHAFVCLCIPRWLDLLCPRSCWVGAGRGFKYSSRGSNATQLVKKLVFGNLRSYYCFTSHPTFTLNCSLNLPSFHWTGP